MTPGEHASGKRVKVKVWDLPVRIFHWAIVVLLVFQVVSARIGGDMMAWHVYSGYAALILIVFRVLWGFFGSTHSRFASFLAGPAATLRFAKRLFSREAVPQVGHNPLGGWSVIAMIGLLGFQAVSGLFANDGASTEGPFAQLVSIETSNLLTEMHRWNLRLLVLISVMHIAAVLFHLFAKKEDLTTAMFTGVQEVPEAAIRERREPGRKSPLRRAASREPAASYFASNWLALAILLAAVALVGLTIRGLH
jgi:cytochrome b